MNLDKRALSENASSACKGSSINDLHPPFVLAHSTTSYHLYSFDSLLKPSMHLLFLVTLIFLSPVTLLRKEQQNQIVQSAVGIHKLKIV